MLIPYWEDNCYNDAGDKMKKKKLILFDMDGTLIDWRQGIDKPTKQMFEAFQKLREHGFLVMIASGRLLPLITVPLRGFEFDGYLLSDGAHVILNGEEINNDMLVSMLLNSGHGIFSDNDELETKADSKESAQK